MKKLVGVGRLIKCRQCDEAEYAVIVTDSWQKKKLGYILSLMCLNLAKHLGIRIVHAEIIDENFPMIKVLNRCSFKMETKERNMLLMSLMLK
jgi:acetyltransferase